MRLTPPFSRAPSKTRLVTSYPSMSCRLGREATLTGFIGFDPVLPQQPGVFHGFSQILPFVALTRFWGVCFRSQRPRLARLMGEFSDGFLTVVAAMVFGLQSPRSS